jgi:hypothetical protein
MMNDDLNEAVYRLAALGEQCAQLGRVLGRYGLRLKTVDADEPIPGSYWGDPEAGLIGDTLYASPKTPLHSILHEACHWICMDPRRRGRLHTDAGGDDPEESAVCYLQVILADTVPGLGRARLFSDMDAWGYSFRLGSARNWFEQDAEDARLWLAAHELIDWSGHPTWRVRQMTEPAYT